MLTTDTNYQNITPTYIYNLGYVRQFLLAVPGRWASKPYPTEKKKKKKRNWNNVASPGINLLAARAALSYRSTYNRKEFQ